MKPSKGKTKRSSDPIIKVVTEIIYKMDPQELARYDFSEDEYQPEAEKIVKEFRAHPKATDIVWAGRVCHGIFISQFSCDSSQISSVTKKNLDKFNWIQLGEAILWVVRNPEEFE